MQDKAVTLPELLQSRDERARRQRELIRRYNAPLVSFMVNYPGAVKQNMYTERIHRAGSAALAEALKDVLLHGETREMDTGIEGYYAVNMDVLALKRLTCAIEDDHPLGRLFDMDVIGTDGLPVGREQVGRPARTCILCGDNPAVCRRESRHSMEELLERIHGMADAFD